MNSMNENPISVNPVKSRAEYMRLAEKSLADSRRIMNQFDEERDDSEYAMRLMDILAREAFVFAKLAKLAPAETPSPVSDPCADELARQLAEQTAANGALMMERGALLDLLTRVHLNHHRINDRLNDDILEILKKAGRL